MNWQLWGRGLLAAIINSVVTTGVAMLTDPGHMTEPLKLGVTLGISAVTGALLYLKTHPPVE